jgi:hypothetical protein
MLLLLPMFIRSDPEIQTLVQIAPLYYQFQNIVSNRTCLPNLLTSFYTNCQYF